MIPAGWLISWNIPKENPQNGSFFMDSPIKMDDLDDYVRKISFISWIYSISISHMVAYIPYKMDNSYGYPHDLGNLRKVRRLQRLWLRVARATFDLDLRHR
jgi:hypothetical protein